MAYFVALFSPETYANFSKSTRKVAGFGLSRRTAACRVKPGDAFVCYITGVSRWLGLLEVVDGPFVDNKPIFQPHDDPFVIRFRVRPQVWLTIENAIPMYEEAILKSLSFTQKLGVGAHGWTGTLRRSLNRLDEGDGKVLTKLLKRQVTRPKIYRLHKQAKRIIDKNSIDRRLSRSVLDGLFNKTI